MSSEELRKIVAKDSNTRLIKELTVGQDVLGEQAISRLDRVHLIGHVTALRMLNANSWSVKSLVPNFDPSKSVFVGLDTGDLVQAGDQKGDGGEGQGASVEKSSDTSLLLVSMINLMQQQMRAAEEKEARREELRIEKEAQNQELRLAEKRAAEEKEARRDELRVAEMKAVEERARKVEEARLMEFRAAEERAISLENLRREELRFSEQRKADEIRLTGELARQLEEDKRVERERLDDRVEVRLAKALKVMRSVLYCMPTDSLNLTLYFQHIWRKCLQ